MSLDARLYNKTNGSERLEAQRGPSVLAASMSVDARLYNKTNGSERMEAHRGPSMLAASMGLDAVLYNKTNGSECMEAHGGPSMLAASMGLDTFYIVKPMFGSVEAEGDSGLYNIKKKESLRGLDDLQSLSSATQGG